MEKEMLTRTRAQKLRKNATKEENRLWYQFLRTHPVQFKRQRVIGQYIVDFFCSAAGLIIELDGGQHYEAKGIEYDKERTEYLEQIREYKVLRFSNLDVSQNFEGVCVTINEALKNLPLGGKVPPEGADEGAGSGQINEDRPLISHGFAVPASPRGEAFRGESMKTVTIYTDGACSGNPGPGGWGAILMYGEHKKELSGGEKQTTNNRMELTGVIEALRALKEPCVVELYSDSKYVIDALEKGWARGWKAKGWIKSDKKPALNPDLWEILLGLCDYHKVNLHWVKGHASNPHNNRCDELAVAQSQQYK